MKELTLDINIKYLIIISLLAISVLCCKQSPDPNPNTIRLTKVETYVLPNGNTTLEYLVAHTNEFRPNTTEEYFYDSQARPIEMRRSFDGQVVQIYTAEYMDGQIGKVSLKAPSPLNPFYNATATFTWAGDSVIANEVYNADATIINSRYEFNANKLPTRKVWRRTSNSVGADQKVVYDEQGNIKTLNISGYIEEYEYDLSKFNPYACSSEMRWFTSFSNFNYQLIPFETYLSTNWVSQLKRNQTLSDSPSVVIETNPIGYATKIRFQRSVKLFYYN